MSRYAVPAATPDQPHCTEMIIRRSRFLALCAHTPGPVAARAFVEEIRRRHADATHNCWAYAAGAPGHTAQIGSSDDGEPHGTAGRPMLQVMLHSGVGGITVRTELSLQAGCDIALICNRPDLVDELLSEWTWDASTQPKLAERWERVAGQGLQADCEQIGLTTKQNTVV